MQGHTDVALDSEGHQQADRIAARLCCCDRKPTAVYCSDLKRARATAEAVANRLGLEVIIRHQLRETMLGDWEGLTQAEIVARGDSELLRLYREDSYRNRPPNAETMDSVWQRLTAAGAEIRSQHRGEAIAIVGHGGSLRALICEALDAPITSMKHIWLSNASLSVVEETYPAEDRKFLRVSLINDTSHLSATLS